MSGSPSLQGLGVVLTRPIGQVEPTRACLEALGARVIAFPCLAVEAVTDEAALADVARRVAAADLVIFVSANAVAFGLPAVRRFGEWPARVRVAAIGEATARALRKAGIAEVLAPAAPSDTEHLVALPELQQVRGQNIIIVRATEGREKLRQVLQERGAGVSYAQVYRRSLPATDPAPVLAAWQRGEVQVVQAMSTETLAHAVDLLGEAGKPWLARSTLVVNHAAVAAHEAARRFARVLVAAPGDEGLVQTLGQLGRTA